VAVTSSTDLLLVTEKEGARTFRLQKKKFLQQWAAAGGWAGSGWWVPKKKILAMRLEKNQTSDFSVPDKK